MTEPPLAASAPPDLDVVIPVYQEAENIHRALDALRDHVRTPYRVLVCYDDDDDSTLDAVRTREAKETLVLVKNTGRGAHGAVLSGFSRSTAPAVLMLPADDNYNAPVLDAMVDRMREGHVLVCASRFMPGGSMKNCPLLKAMVVRTAAFLLRHVARLPTRDATNGFRLFSRQVLDAIPIESSQGFTYSIELLTKCHRLGWSVVEHPVQWIEREAGGSRFRMFRWGPAYIRWCLYALATTWLRRGPNTVRLNENRARSS